MRDKRWWWNVSRIGWPAGLALAAALLLLSGCSLLGLLPGSGGMALIVALLIAGGAGALNVSARRGTEARPAHSAGAPLPAESEAVLLRGDGAHHAAWSLWLDRTLLAEARRRSAHTLFASRDVAPAGAAAQIRADDSPAPVIVQGDGERGADALPAAPAPERRTKSAGALPFEPGRAESKAVRAESPQAPLFVTAELRGDGIEPTEPYRLVLGRGQRMNPKEADSEAIDRGAVTFNSRCGTYCHGGQAIGGHCPSLIDEFWMHGDSDLEVYKIIAGGAGPGKGMGAFGGELSMDQIWEIIAYLRVRGQEYLMEKAGPNSFRQKGKDCPNEIFLTLTVPGNSMFEGVLKIEDKDHIMLEDRGQALVTEFRVDKSRILDAKVSCLK